MVFFKKRRENVKNSKKNQKKASGGGIYIDEIKNELLKLQEQNSLIYRLLVEANRDNLNLVFNSIYESNFWGYGSGPGSDEKLCENYVKFLQDFFKEKKITSIVDCGCGDWQFSKNIDFSGIDYKGFDVANFVIEKNINQFQKENVSFFLYKGDFNLLPNADLIICKDVLQHLNNGKISEFIANLYRFKFALITNDIGKDVNNDCLNGGYRSIDLRKAPFNLDLKVVFEIVRMPKAPDMLTMLWENPGFK